jgi:excinuclease ABC subunit B
VGINLLREGLDIPEVSLVAILDADKEGYLRSERSLIQTIGRAARNVNGQVILYADQVTDSMRRAIDETNRRRVVQETFNREHDITPQTIQKAIASPWAEAAESDYVDLTRVAETPEEYRSVADIPKRVAALQKEMREAAANLEFERAAALRDEIQRLQQQELALRGE